MIFTLHSERGRYDLTKQYEENRNQNSKTGKPDHSLQEASSAQLDFSDVKGQDDLIEAILLAAMAGGLLWRMKHRREHSVRLRDALFMLGLVETLMISMRRDTYMMWGFVHQEQLYFYLLSAGIVMLAGFERRRLPASVAVSLLTAGAIIFLEFALDGRVRVPFAFMQAWADEFWYSLFILVLAGFAAWYFRLGRPEREEKTV